MQFLVNTRFKFTETNYHDIAAPKFIMNHVVLMENGALL